MEPVDGSRPEIPHIEALDPRCSKILSNFSRRSGFPMPEVQRRLGNSVMSQLLLPYDEIVITYYKEDPGSKDVENLGKIVERDKRLGTDNSRLAFWSTLLSYQLSKGEDIGAGNEQVYEAIASSGLHGEQGLEAQLKAYERTGWSFHKDIWDDLANEATRRSHPLFLNYSEEEIERRAQVVQMGLDEIQKVGLDIIKEGKIPLIRVLRLSPEQTEEFISKHKGEREFIPKDAHIGLDGYTLDDLISHGDIKLKENPMDSWTYAAPTGAHFYGYGWLGVVDQLVLISERPREELLWERELPAHVPNGWKFYKEHSMNAPALPGLPEDHLLATLDKEGFKGVITPSEYEATMWGPQPIKGIVNIQAK